VGSGRSIPAPSNEAPVLVCSAGCISGSTLLQRMLMTDPSILVWSEPMDRLGVLAHLTDIVAGVCGDWPRGWRYVSQRGLVSLT
jgi:hypothetical protein